jgi:hypothetical protein
VAHTNANLFTGTGTRIRQSGTNHHWETEPEKPQARGDSSELPLIFGPIVLKISDPGVKLDKECCLPRGFIRQVDCGLNQVATKQIDQWPFVTK